MTAQESNTFPIYDGSGWPINDGPDLGKPRNMVEPPEGWDCWNTCYLYALFSNMCSKREFENCLATGNPNHDRAGA